MAHSCIWLARYLLALVLSVLGITKRASAILVAWAVIATPFSLYLGGSPRVGWLGDLSEFGVRFKDKAVDIPSNLPKLGERRGCLTFQ